MNDPLIPAFSRREKENEISAAGKKPNCYYTAFVEWGAKGSVAFSLSE